MTTVSRRYAKEIQTPEYGCGLEGVIRNRADRLVGILNGVDYAAWNPEADKFIAQNYSAHNLDGKRACKKDLLDMFELPEENLERPLVGIVSRFADQKGFDLIAEVADGVDGGRPGDRRAGHGPAGVREAVHASWRRNIPREWE